MKTITVLAVALLLTGCTADDRASRAREAVDDIYGAWSKDFIELPSYDELADSLVEDASASCDTVAAYVAGLGGNVVLEEAYRAASAIMCD